MALLDALQGKKRLTSKATGRQAPSACTRWGIVLEHGEGLDGRRRGREEAGAISAVAEEQGG